MKAIFFPVLIFTLGVSTAAAQTRLAGHVLDEHGESMPNVNILIEGTSRGTITDSDGRFELNLDPGSYRLRFQHIGYEDQTEDVTLDSTAFLTIRLRTSDHETEVITISSTRLSRTIDDTPTRVEIIAGEELDEKSNMRSSDIRMQLNESTGIQVQQTSATSANSTFRLQGLDGRYTLLLKDGFPIYSGFSSGLSILHIPPLDLKQIEVIKGSASTLHGGGAIAGLINLISREPEQEPVTSAMLNATTAGGQDLSLFTARRRDGLAYSLFASGHLQAAYDANDDDFTDIPRVRRVTLNPRMYLYPNSAGRLMIAAQASAEERKGGDIERIRSSTDTNHVYFETHDSRRLAFQAEYLHQVGRSERLSFRSSIMGYRRRIKLPDVVFEGSQRSFFSEAMWSRDARNFEYSVGANIHSDDFDQERNSATDYTHSTFGIFSQSQIRFTDIFSIESGVRADHVNAYGWFVLPRAYGLFRWGTKWTSRFGGGFGYKIPTIFNEIAEEKAFQEVRALNGTEKAERSVGANWDVNYKSNVAGVIGLNINQLLFYTRITDPLGYDADSLQAGIFRTINRKGYYYSYGTELNMRLSYADFKFFLGYTFTSARSVQPGPDLRIPFVAAHRLGLVLIYEIEHKGRIGLESYFTGSQRRSDQSTTRAFWVSGIMAERKWRRFSVFINFENIFDTRQSKYEPAFDGTRQRPDFREIYAPVDGFVANGGIKWTL